MGLPGCTRSIHDRPTRDSQINRVSICCSKGTIQQPCAVPERNVTTTKHFFMQRGPRMDRFGRPSSTAGRTVSSCVHSAAKCTSPRCESRWQLVGQTPCGGNPFPKRTAPDANGRAPTRGLAGLQGRVVRPLEPRYGRVLRLGRSRGGGHACLQQATAWIENLFISIRRLPADSRVLDEERIPALYAPAHSHSSGNKPNKPANRSRGFGARACLCGRPGVLPAVAPRRRARRGIHARRPVVIALGLVRPSICRDRRSPTHHPSPSSSSTLPQ